MPKLISGGGLTLPYSNVISRTETTLQYGNQKKKEEKKEELSVSGEPTDEPSPATEEDFTTPNTDKDEQDDGQVGLQVHEGVSLGSSAFSQVCFGHKNTRLVRSW